MMKNGEGIAELFLFLERCLEVGEIEIGRDGNGFFGFSWLSGYVVGKDLRHVLIKMEREARRRKFEPIKFIDASIVEEFEDDRKKKRKSKD